MVRIILIIKINEKIKIFNRINFFYIFIYKFINLKANIIIIKKINVA